jgi:hypothetical protein
MWLQPEDDEVYFAGHCGELVALLPLRCFRVNRSGTWKSFRNSRYIAGSQLPAISGTDTNIQTPFEANGMPPTYETMQ